MQNQETGTGSASQKATVGGKTCDFSHALEAVKGGGKIYRNGWNGKGMYVILETPTKIGFIPYLLFRTVIGDFVPFVASNTDLLATDWVIQAN